MFLLYVNAIAMHVRVAMLLSNSLKMMLSTMREKSKRKCGKRRRGKKITNCDEAAQVCGGSRKVFVFVMSQNYNIMNK